MIKAYGAAWTFGAMAVVMALVAVWGLFTPALRGLDAAPSVASDATAGLS